MKGFEVFVAVLILAAAVLALANRQVVAEIFVSLFYRIF
jgi:Tfp pilus assembly protein PilV